ncbi:MAG: hypothetical protein ACRDHS_11555 [Actinomycetota bacterium]
MILQNGDPDMLESVKPYIGFEFDQYISIATSGYFKPHVATYRKAAEILDTDIGRIMHVANHPRLAPRNPRPNDSASPSGPARASGGRRRGPGTRPCGSADGELHAPERRGSRSTPGRPPNP